MHNQLLIIIIISGLSACSAPGVKPKDANLFEAATNISSGEFDSQLSRKKFKLKKSQDVVNAENTQSQDLNKQLHSVKAQKQVLDKQLVTLQKQNKALFYQANQTRAINSAQQTKRNLQVAKIKKLNLSISDFKAKQRQASTSSNSEYKVKVDSLKNEINVLRKMISNQ
jgi:chromosome segregation ATPase